LLNIPEPQLNILAFPPISIEDVRKVVKKMKRRKTSGADEITADVLIAGGEP